MQTEGNQLIRFDKNIGNNFITIHDKDSNLIKDLIAFFSFDFEKNICKQDFWGNRILDPKELAHFLKRTNYRTFHEKHPDPEQLKQKMYAHLSSEEKKQLIKESMELNGEALFVSLLDNALYRCYQEMVFTVKGKSLEGNKESELVSMRILKHLKKIYVPRTKKIYYEFQTSDVFNNDLARYFFKLDIKTLVSFGQKEGLKNLYVALTVLRDRFNAEKKHTVTLTPNPPKDIFKVNKMTAFDYLCHIINTEYAEPAKRKQMINKALKELNKALGYNFVLIKWEGGKGKHKYIPELTFNLSELELREIKDKAHESQKRLMHFVYINLQNKYREIISNEIRQKEQYDGQLEAEVFFKNNFFRFLSQPDNLIEIKCNVINNTYLQCFGKYPTDSKTGEVDLYSPGLMLIIKEELPKKAKEIVDSMKFDY